MEDFEFKNKETIKTPEKLYRGFVIDPNNLSVELLKESINPTETSGKDGNERGVYMTDNLTMVESTNYSFRNFGAIKTPLYDSGRGIIERINLPGCGIILQIDAKDLSIREPKIHSTWQGHYNNGFAGKEWITDSVPMKKYKVKILTLSEGATDPNKFSIELKDGNEEELKDAIEIIKTKYQEKKDEAIKFRDFLYEIPEMTRMITLSWKPKWEEYKKSNNK